MNQNKDFQMTKEEVDRFQSAMEKPEFRKLLGDYLDEISDPKNKAEYDQYLKELEENRELPKGMKLMEPKPGFCLKTVIKNKKKAEYEQKLFINICSAYDIERPHSSKDKKKKAGERGQSWSVPHSTGVLRYDQDKHQKMCNVVDVIFNPLVFEFSLKQENFKKMVCDISIQAATQRLKEADETISQDYKILKNTKCFGEKPAVIPIRSNQEFKPSEPRKPGEMDADRVRNEDVAPKLYQEFMKQQKKHQFKEANEKLQSNRIQELASHDFETIDENQEKAEITEVSTKPGSITRPKYEIVHSFGVELSHFIANGPTNDNRRPTELVVKVHIPKVDKMKEVDLDVNEKTLVVKVPEKYYLDLELPFKVNSDEGKAKFEQKTKLLKVTLPVIKEETPVADQVENKENQQNEEHNDEPQNKGEITELKATPEQDFEVIDEKQENQTEVDNGEHPLKFVSKEGSKAYEEEQIKHIENIGAVKETKSLVEVVDEASENKSDKSVEIISEQPVKQKKINNAFEFKTQEVEDKYFLIFNVLEYSKDKCEVAFLENQVLFQYVDADREYRAWVEFKDKVIDIKKSIVNFVTDFIVINIQKADEGYWENSSFEMKEYTEKEFQNGLDIYKDNLKIWEEEKANEIKEIQMTKEEAPKTEEQEQEQNEEESEVQKSENEKPNEEKKTEKLDEDPEVLANQDEDLEQRLENRIDKRSINFVQFDRKTFAFELD